jgi:hypothetical protein
MSLFHTAAVAAVGALGLYGALQQYAFVRDADQQNRDPFRIIEIQANVGTLAARLPAGSEVGFFTDLPPAEVAARGAFIAAQYGLAPHLLVRDTEKPRYVIGVFAQSKDLQGAGDERGLEVVEVLSPGFVLFEKKKAAQ